MIYSETFDALPEMMKAHLHQRLWDILSGNDTKPDFETLTPGVRRAILEILCDTKPGLPDYWKAATREKPGMQEPQSK